MATKQKYKVYLVGTGHGCYMKDYYCEYIGQTWAVSPEKAISNIKYRLKQEGYSPRDYSFDTEDTWGRGYVHYDLEAVLASEDPYVEAV